MEYPDGFEIELGLEQQLTESAALESALAAVRGRRRDGWRFPDDGRTMYFAWLSVADGWKVGGCPDWVQDPAYPVCSCGATMAFLVQCRSTEFDGVSWGRWLPIQDREALTDDYAIRSAVQAAPDVTFGDVGNVYVFHCPTCKARPIRAFMQCS